MPYLQVPRDPPARQGVRSAIAPWPARCPLKTLSSTSPGCWLMQWSCAKPCLPAIWSRQGSGPGLLPAMPASSALTTSRCQPQPSAFSSVPSARRHCRGTRRRHSSFLNTSSKRSLFSQPEQNTERLGLGRLTGQSPARDVNWEKILDVVPRLTSCRGKSRSTSLSLQGLRRKTQGPPSTHASLRRNHHAAGNISGGRGGRRFEAAANAAMRPARSKGSLSKTAPDDHGPMSMSERADRTTMAVAGLVARTSRSIPGNGSFGIPP